MEDDEGTMRKGLTCSSQRCGKCHLEHVCPTSAGVRQGVQQRHVICHAVTLVKEHQINMDG
ncbi:hypothetical protein E2C01_075006 [Portunus trituberculatus]|uniref:Uncharacterized protein n=1 Tax=Portunus trituberculatus TaxID=210409 RepID=A0A5B7IEM9_PORTR|nr:hypothetical protein [Portunus trituberculatus]